MASVFFGATIVKFRINWALCTGEVRKPRLPGDESVSLFLGFTINSNYSLFAH